MTARRETHPADDDANIAAQIEQYLALRRQGNLESAQQLTEECQALRDVVDQLEDLASLVNSEATAASPLQEGLPHRLGKYLVRQRLGAGGQSEALLAFDPELARLVVIKRFQVTEDRIESRRVIAEGRALARVRSPHVAECYGVDWHDGEPYLVMEYIRGQPLCQAIHDRPLTPVEAVHVIAQVAAGLAETHACGMLHGDIKSSNIMMTPGGVAKLIDFGLARPIAGEGVGDRLGTAAFIAPERARGELDGVDQRSDIFSLGAVLYEMLTGKPPFQAETTRESLKLAAIGAVTPAKDLRARLPAWINDLCMKCLAVNPPDRFASAQQLQLTIEAGLRRRHLLRHRVTPVAMVAAAIALAMILTALFGLPNRDDSDSSSALQAVAQKAGSIGTTAPTVAAENPGPPDGSPSFRFDAADAAYWQHVEPSFRNLLGDKSLRLRTDFPVAVSVYERPSDERGRVVLREGETVTVGVEPGEDCFLGVYSVEFGKDAGSPVSFIPLFPNADQQNHLVKSGESVEMQVTAALSQGFELIYVYASKTRWNPETVPSLGRAWAAKPDAEAQLRSAWRGLRLAKEISECMVPYVVVPISPQRTAELKGQRDQLVADAQAAELADRHQDAIQLRSQALSIDLVIAIDDRPTLIEDYRDLAALYDRTEQFQTAADLYNQLRRVYQWEFGQRHWKAETAAAQRRMAQNRAGLDADGLAAWRSAADRIEQARQLRSAGDLAGAIQAAGEARETCRRIFPKADGQTAEACYELAMAQALSHNLGDCRRSTDEALQLVDRLYPYEDDHPKRAWWKSRFGEMFLAAGQSAEAEGWLRIAAQHLQPFAGELPVELADAKVALSTALLRNDKTDEARQLLNEAAKTYLAELGPQDVRLARVYQLLGQLNCASGNNTAAHMYLTRSIRLYQGQVGENALALAEVKLTLARLYRDVGYYQESRDHLNQALVVLEPHQRTNPLPFAQAIELRGMIRMDHAKLADARQDMQQSLELFQQHGASRVQQALCKERLGTIHLKLGQLAEAERLYREAYQFALDHFGEDDRLTAEFRMGLGDVSYRRGEIQSAIDDYEQALCIHHRLDGPDLQSRPLSEGLIYSRLTWNVFGSYLTLLDSSNPDHAQRAYQWARRLRGRATDLMRDRRQWMQRQENAGTLQRDLAAVNRQLSRLLPARRLLDLTPELGKLLRQKEELERQFIPPAGSRDNQPPDEIGLAELVRNLRPGDAMVDTMVSHRIRRDEPELGREMIDYRYDAFVLRPTTAAPGYTLTWVELGPAAAIDALVLRWFAYEVPRVYRGLIPAGLRPEAVDRDAPIDDRADLRTALREMFWGKLEPLLAGCSTVIVIPSGQLMRIPLAALPGHRPDTYLIDEMAFVRAAHWLDVYDPPTPKLTGEPSLLAIGGVDYDRVEAGIGSAKSDLDARFADRLIWSPLKESRSEVDDVADLWSGPKTVISGGAATKQTVLERMPASRFIHLATHGHRIPTDELMENRDYNDPRSMELISSFVDNPWLRSWLVLAGANRPRIQDRPQGSSLLYEGILTAEEIANLDLSGVELVTLSTCESSIGQLTAGEGVMGLSRAFSTAGAQSVVGTLWRVEDRAARALMVEFYRNFCEKKMNKVDALRAAQLAMRQGKIRIAQPPGSAGKAVPVDYWAPWVLSGDWRTLAAPSSLSGADDDRVNANAELPSR